MLEGDDLAQIGGQAFGLKIARALQGRISRLSCAPFRIVVSKDAATARTGLELLLSDPEIAGFPVIMRVSHGREAFSDRSERGQTSSRENPRGIFNKSFVEDVLDWLAAPRDPPILSVIVQRNVQSDRGCHFIAHVRRDRFAIEITHRDQRASRYVIQRGQFRQMLESPVHSDVIHRNKSTLQVLEELLPLARSHLPFDVDLEGHAHRSSISVFQLRKIPSDFSFVDEPSLVLGQTSDFQSALVHGSFRMQAVCLEGAAISCLPRDETFLYLPSDELAIKGAARLSLAELFDLRSVGQLPDANVPYVLTHHVDRMLQGSGAILIRDGGFLLQHSPAHLPRFRRARSSFRVIYHAHADRMVGRFFDILCDGYAASLRVLKRQNERCEAVISGAPRKEGRF